MTKLPCYQRLITKACFASPRRLDQDPDVPRMGCGRARNSKGCKRLCPTHAAAATEVQAAVTSALYYVQTRSQLLVHPCGQRKRRIPNQIRIASLEWADYNNLLPSLIALIIDCAIQPDYYDNNGTNSKDVCHRWEFSRL